MTARTAAANAANERRQRVGAGLRAGTVDLRAVLVAIDGEHREIRAAAAKLTVRRLLLFVPGIGEKTVAIVCAAAAVGPGERLGHLPASDRQALAEELTRRFDPSTYCGVGRPRLAR